MVTPLRQKLASWNPLATTGPVPTIRIVGLAKLQINHHPGEYGEYGEYGEFGSVQLDPLWRGQPGASVSHTARLLTGLSE